MERHIPEKGNLLERIKWQGLSYFAIALVAYGCSHNKQEREKVKTGNTFSIP